MQGFSIGTLFRFMLNLEREMGKFKDEMSEFKEEMREDQKKAFKQWGDIANKMGTLASGRN